MLNKILPFFIILLSQFIYSQDYEFGKVSKEELIESSYTKDTSANAAVLYKKHDTYFIYNLGGVQVITEVHERIKIYNKEGFDYATKAINLFKSGNVKQTIGKIKAYTYNYNGGKIEKTELSKNQIFKNELTYNFDQVKFTMPNVKEGSVIEFRYKTTSPYIYYIDEIVLQYDIPIKKVIAELRTPEVLKFNKTQKGHILFFPKSSAKMDHRLGMNVIVNTFELNEVPALKEESHVDNIDNYRAGVLIELVSISIPGEFTRNYARTWKDVASTIGNSDDYKNKLDKANYFDEALDPILMEANNGINRMKKIFNFVKDQIKWNGNEGIYGRVLAQLGPAPARIAATRAYRDAVGG